MNTIYLITFFCGQSLLLLSFFFLFYCRFILSFNSIVNRQNILVVGYNLREYMLLIFFFFFFSSSRIYSIHQEIILLHIPYFFAVKKKKYDFFITSNASVLYCLSLFLFVIIVLTETFLVL
jgi:hypothetical protein